MAVPVVTAHTFYLAPYPVVRVVLVVIAAILELLATFNIGLGGLPLIPLGLAIFFLSFL